MNVERPRAFSTQPTSFNCSRVQRSKISDSWDQIVPSPLPSPLVLPTRKNHTHTDTTPLWSLSVLKPLVWCVSRVGGVKEQQRSGGPHLAGRSVTGDAADAMSQSWNVPGSVSLGCFTFSRLPDKTGRSVRDSGSCSSFFCCCFCQRHVTQIQKRGKHLASKVSIVRPVNISPEALQKSCVRWFASACWWHSTFLRRRLETCLCWRSLSAPAPTQHRWDLRCVLCPPAVYTGPLCQASTISRLLFSFDSTRKRETETEAACRDL